MGLYEELYEKYNKLNDLEIRSTQDIRSLLSADLANVRIVKNMLKEIIPFNEVIASKEVQDMIELVNRWEKQILDKVGMSGTISTDYCDEFDCDQFNIVA